MFRTAIFSVLAALTATAFTAQAEEPVPTKEELIAAAAAGDVDKILELSSRMPRRMPASEATAPTQLPPVAPYPLYSLESAGSHVIYIGEKPPLCDGMATCFQIEHPQCSWIQVAVDGRPVPVVMAGNQFVSAGFDRAQYALVQAIPLTGDRPPLSAMPPAPCTLWGSELVGAGYSQGWLVLKPPSPGNAAQYRIGGAVYLSAVGGPFTPFPAWGVGGMPIWRATVDYMPMANGHCATQTVTLGVPGPRTIKLGANCPGR